MISANQAQDLARLKDESYLVKMDEAIRIVASRGERKLSLRTGLTKDAWERQEKIYSGFTGTLPNFLIEALRLSGYTVEENSSYQGVNITISW